MKEELEKKLLQTYPSMFEIERYGRTIMLEIGIGDGWYSLLERACALIKNHYDWRVNQRDLALNTNNAIITQNWEFFPAWIREKVKADPQSHYRNDVPDEVPEFKFAQIKEKFGTLRLYADNADKYAQGVLAMAEAMSGITCEETGKPGVGHVREGGGWLRVLDPEWAAQNGYVPTKHGD